MIQSAVKKAIDWSLLVVTTVYLLGGLGIMHYRVVEPLTFGLLGKGLSFELHENLLLPFLALLSMHLLLRPILWTHSKLKSSMAN